MLYVKFKFSHYFLKATTFIKLFVLYMCKKIRLCSTNKSDKKYSYKHGLEMFFFK